MSKALANVANSPDLVDLYETNLTKPQYTHYTRHGASRIDRIYITKTLNNRKTGTNTLIAPFSDHMAVIVHLTYQRKTYRQKYMGWKMNTSLLDDKVFGEKLAHQMKSWGRTKSFFPTKTMWWERTVRKHFARLFNVRVQSERET